MGKPPTSIEAASRLSEEDLELLRNRVFFIGGGTCSGKTTLAEKLCRGEAPSLAAMLGEESSSCILIGESSPIAPPTPFTPTAPRMFSADDVLIECAAKAHADGSEVAANALSTDFERRWMRDPSEQLSEMLGFYHDVFPYIAAELAHFTKQLAHEQPTPSNEAANANPQAAIPNDPAQLDAPLVIAEGIAFLPELLARIGIPKDRCLFLVAEKQAHDRQYSQRDWVPLMLEGCSDPQTAFDRWMQRDGLFSQHVREQCAHLGYMCE